MGLKAGRVGIHPSQVDPITGMLLNGPTPGNISFEDLSDAQISNPEVGQTLIYNGNKWENEFSSISPTTLSALQDVQITDPEDGDYLMYDSENSKWINSGEAPAPTYTDITVTMYGAVEDTISFTDAAGISHTEVFASGQSSKTVTFKINPSGSTSITFTSAVAKDPDNLSNDYAKTISVTSATTSIYVMPDGAFYWYGNTCGGLDKSIWKCDSDGTLNTNSYYYISTHAGDYENAYPYTQNKTCNGFSTLKFYGWASADVLLTTTTNKMTSPSSSGASIGGSENIYTLDVSSRQSAYPSIGIYSGLAVTMKAMWLE